MSLFEFTCTTCGESVEAQTTSMGNWIRCPNITCNVPLSIPHILLNRYPNQAPQISALSYDQWNTSVGNYCFNIRNANREIRFAVDPIVLQHAAVESPTSHRFLTPEEASRDFCIAVSNEISRDGWELGETQMGVFPHGLSKLALQVLAVFQISSNDEKGNGYWAALHTTLGRPVPTAGVSPSDLDLDTHQENWSKLARWANDLNRGQLGRIPIDLGGYIHVGIPMGHGLLRKEDISRLGLFYQKVGISPYEKVTREEILDELKYYAQDVTIFPSQHARRVLKGQRVELAAEQIAVAAAQWDGTNVDLQKDVTELRGSVFRMWLSLRRSAHHRISGSQVYHLKANPKYHVTKSVHTQIFGGLIEKVTNRDNEDVPNVALNHLFNKSGLNDLLTPVPYKPIDKNLLIAVLSLLDYRFVESRDIHIGDEVVIAYKYDQDSAEWEQELCAIANEGQLTKLGIQDDGIPDDWVFYRLMVREDLIENEVPGFLDGRIKITGLRIKVSGGLKVRSDWIVGAGPTLTVQGGKSDKVVVDGEEYDLIDGCLYPENCPDLNNEGLHMAWLPGVGLASIKFRVIHPNPVKFPSPVVEAGWMRNDLPEWPTNLNNILGTKTCIIRGPVVEGDWPAVKPLVEFDAPEQVAIRLALAVRKLPLTGGTDAIASLKAENQLHPNLLVRQLALAIRPVTKKVQR